MICLALRIEIHSNTSETTGATNEAGIAYPFGAAILIGFALNINCLSQ
jgi:hypothetical protein